MPKHKPKEPQSAQSKRFEAAKDLGCDPSEANFERLMRKANLRAPVKTKEPAKATGRRKK